MIGGVQKGGTTALDKFLRQHPEVCMSVEKEAHFFDFDTAYFGPDRAPNIATYHRMFAPKTGSKVVGEATPIYLFLPHIPERIAAYSSGMKWIILLRNPIERAYSQYLMEFRRGTESWPFEKALRWEWARNLVPQSINDSRCSRRCHSYMARGMYASQLLNLWRHFPKDQTLILLSEELLDLHDETLERVTKFLGVGSLSVPHERVHTAGSDKEMSPEARKILSRALRPEIEKVGRLLGRDLSSWMAS